METSTYISDLFYRVKELGVPRPGMMRRHRSLGILSILSRSKVQASQVVVEEVVIEQAPAENEFPLPTRWCYDDVRKPIKPMKKEFVEIVTSQPCFQYRRLSPESQKFLEDFEKERKLVLETPEKEEAPQRKLKKSKKELDEFQMTHTLATVLEDYVAKGSKGLRVTKGEEVYVSKVVMTKKHERMWKVKTLDGTKEGFVPFPFLGHAAYADEYFSNAL